MFTYIATSLYCISYIKTIHTGGIILMWYFTEYEYDTLQFVIYVRPKKLEAISSSSHEHEGPGIA